MSKIDRWKRNELQMLLLCCRKALERQIEVNPKSGVITHKGEKTERKMTYTKALECLEKFEDLYAMSGAFSFGICGECSKFSTAGHQSRHDCFGHCGGKSKHCYDSCVNHGKKGGGYGLDYSREDRPE